MASKERAVSVGGDADIKASMLAAFERIRNVPVGPTLIDSISEADWNDEAAAVWNCCAGSNVDDADELDAIDHAERAVA